MKKFLSVFLAIILVAMAAMPVFAVGVPSLKVEVDVMAGFSVGDATIPLILNNFSDTAITVTKIDIAKNDSFNATSVTPNVSIVKGTPTTVNVPVTYSGKSNVLQLKVTTSTNTILSTSVVVTAATPAIDTDKDPKPDTPTAVVPQKIVPYLSLAKFNKKDFLKENKATLTLNVTNPTSTVRDMVINFMPEKSPGFTMYDNFEPRTISTLSSGSSFELYYNVFVSSATESGNYPLTFDISYKDDMEKPVRYESTVFAEVYRSIKPTDDKAVTSKPRIIIANYSKNVDVIKAGKEFELTFALKNTSNTVNVSNLKVVLSSGMSAAASGGTGGGGGAVFFPSQGSNSFYISKLGTQKSVSNKIKLMSRQDVEPSVYQVVLNLEYEDEKGTPYTAEENISFAVVQEQRLSITGLNIPTDGAIGNPIPINFQYINKGKSTIYNFAIKVEGNFALEDGGKYVGNLTAGFNDTFDGNIVPSGNVGENSGTLLFTYETASGDPMEQRQEFKVNLAETPPIDPSMPTTPEIPIDKGNSNMTIIIIVVCVVLAGGFIAGFIIYKRKKKAKMLASLDEE